MTFNLIDLALCCVLILSLILNKGLSFVKESIKFVGVIIATIVAVHYYSSFGVFLKGKQLILEPYNNLLAFIVLAAVTIYLFILIAETWVLIIKFKFSESFDKNAAWVFSVIRTYVVISLAYFAFLIAGGVLEQTARNALTRVVWSNTSFGIYQGFYNKIVKPFFSNEAINENAVELILGPQDIEEGSTEVIETENLESNMKDSSKE